MHLRKRKQDGLTPKRRLWLSSPIPTAWNRRENYMEVQNPALVKCEPINFLEYVQSSEYVFSGRKQRPGEKGRDGTSFLFNTCFPKCGPQTISIIFPGWFVRNTLLGPTLNSRIRELLFKKILWSHMHVKVWEALSLWILNPCPNCLSFGSSLTS